MFDTIAKIDEARSLVEAGRSRQAARILRQCTFATAEPALLEEIHELAIVGVDKAHPWQKSFWYGPLANSRLRYEHFSGTAAPSSFEDDLAEAV